MSEVLTVEIPDELARQVRAIAAATSRPVEDVVVECLGRAIVQPSLQSLGDEELLQLCDAQMEPAKQDELSEFLARSREGQLQPDERATLDQLFVAYRRGLVTKAQAWNEAVARGLKPPLSDDAA
jgi:predicted transcriptional regulator